MRIWAGIFMNLISVLGYGPYFYQLAKYTATRPLQIGVG
jgi:hypothetical protein